MKLRRAQVSSSDDVLHDRDDVAIAIRRVAGMQAIEELSRDYARIARLCRDEADPSGVARHSHALWHADQQLRVLQRRFLLSGDPTLAAVPVELVLQVINGLVNADDARAEHRLMVDRHSHIT